MPPPAYAPPCRPTFAVPTDSEPTERNNSCLVRACVGVSIRGCGEGLNTLYIPLVGLSLSISVSLYIFLHKTAPNQPPKNYRFKIIFIRKYLIINHLQKHLFFFIVLFLLYAKTVLVRREQASPVSRLQERVSDGERLTHCPARHKKLNHFGRGRRAELAFVRRDEPVKAETRQVAEVHSLTVPTESIQTKFGR